MATPLSPLSSSNANRIAPPTAERKLDYQSPSKHTVEQQYNESLMSSPGGPPSSPFVADVDPSPDELENPRKQGSPMKDPPEDYEPKQLTEDALRQNEDLRRASQPVEDDTMRTNDFTIHEDTVSAVDAPAGYPGMDDTAFSAFSAVPNADMTRFTRLGQSPTKSAFGSPPKSPFEDAPTPRPTGGNTPSRNRQKYDDGYSSPTPRRHKQTRDNDTTNLLIDFTGQFYPTAERSPSRNGRLSPKKYHTQSELASHLSSRRTPSPAKQALPPGTPSESRHLANLLDFDLPPAPTPRSIPSISARELESMKSAFQSQISSLKAELSGREAEVSSLKNAMGDAERRVGESLEQVREERDAKEGLQAEKADWEKRQKEMQTVLKDVKEEIIRGEREKDQLLQRVSEAESKAVEAESKIAGMRASSSSTAPSESGSTNTNSEVEAAVTKVAKELHGLYKTKHEAKVTALKKSYSERWEKKIKDLQAKIDELSKENDDLKVGRDATMTGVEPGALTGRPDTESEAQKEKERQTREEHEQQLEEQKRQLSNVERELETARRNLAGSTEQNVALVSQLSASRAETAELIAATEELMTLSQNAMASSSSSSAANINNNNNNINAQQPPPAADARATLSRSTSGSGLKAPGFGAESRIGRMPAPGGYGRDRGDGGAGGGGGGGGRSGLLGNIERMGRGRVVE